MNERRTLIFAVATLDFFVLSLLYFAFQNAGSLRFVESGHLEYLSRIEPPV